MIDGKTSQRALKIIGNIVNRAEEMAQDAITNYIKINYDILYRAYGNNAVAIKCADTKNCVVIGSDRSLSKLLEKVKARFSDDFYGIYITKLEWEKER